MPLKKQCTAGNLAMRKSFADPHEAFVSETSEAWSLFCFPQPLYSQEIALYCIPSLQCQLPSLQSPYWSFARAFVCAADKNAFCSAPRKPHDYQGHRALVWTDRSGFAHSRGWTALQVHLSGGMMCTSPSCTITSPGSALFKCCTFTCNRVHDGHRSSLYDLQP